METKSRCNAGTGLKCNADARLRLKAAAAAAAFSVETRRQPEQQPNNVEIFLLHILQPHLQGDCVEKIIWGGGDHK